MKKVTCNDCRNAGVIVAPLDDNEPPKKYCPPEYMWNHPNPETFPNYVMKE